MPHAENRSRAVFQDPSGRRTRVVRRWARAVGIVTTALAIALIVGILVPPLVPSVAIADGPRASTRLPQFLGSRAARERLAARRRLFAALRGHPPAPALRRRALPIRPGVAPVRGETPGRTITAGFYVNWDDNSFVSLRQHGTRLDWVICEWGFVQSADSLRLRVDRRVLFFTQQLPADQRPAVLLMVTNYDSSRAEFDPAALQRLIGSPARRAVVVAQLARAVRTYGLGGVTVDFEEIPDGLHAGVRTFVRELGAALHPMGALVTQALPAEMDVQLLRQYAAVNDDVILMLYDEHGGRGDVGPVASQNWYAAEARRAAAAVPPAKLILAMGAYGYDWNDADPKAAGDERTFQDVMRTAHEQSTPVRFDSTSLNPYLTWTDPDSTDHVLWFLDGVTAYNELLVASRLGAAGSAVWRLGAEDPSVWNVLGKGGLLAGPDTLRSMSAGYDVEFRGSGELLRIDARPTAGRRTIVTQPATGVIVGETVSGVPLPYIVGRTGDLPHRVALTFDDGPDGTWTPMILDTLASRHAPATFFLIGQNVETNIALTRRIARDGHEVGNHTFTHPNLALTSAFVTRLEIDATERIIEAVLNRHTAFFRPPYFGDAEPTTADELVPVALATDLGYVTAGLHVDSDDWERPTPERIISNVLDGRTRAIACTDSLHESRAEDRPLEHGCSGSVVLMHDGGGNRANTVAALGALIDSLRARGDTLVLLSSLAGMTHAAAMPALPTSGAAVRYSELATFGALGAFEFGMYWLFVLAVVLGMARLAIVVGLATAQRFLGRRDAESELAGYLPHVTVVVPAYREERVIVKTVDSLLAQDYAGPLEILVIDDGSPDATYEVAREAYAGDARVIVERKPNGGKASALNFGIARARGVIGVALDADTVFLPNAVRRLVQPMADPQVAAVAGNAKVGNRLNLVTRWQAVEYVTSQNLDRRAFSLLDCITVVPGAIGAWRTSVVRELGGFSPDTLAEDQDLTIAIHRRGYAVAYADDAIALTEAPDTLRGLANQRFRWSFGTLQCMWKHRGALLRRETGTLGSIALPNVWLFQLLLPAASPLADLMFLWSLFSVWLVRQQHGATYAMSNLRQVLVLYAVFLLVDWGAAVIGFFMEPREEKRLTWLVFSQRFVYRQIMYLVVVRSFWAAIHGRIVGWGSLERKATVEART